ncbi:hypothetical protein N7516_010760 [Penicillium verrucosum]|uniref:uncharacterized protein n=1 Tax=Penicillium verrucosum TaxID=60171 RepID=UPI002545AE1D|nr:uncharacterized protein N7516_010760 [Penicillium verrucosum]KAJ5923057.1 hypothetical protein N7516_010760 [Penicillium verrucosum]
MSTKGSSLRVARVIGRCCPIGKRSAPGPSAPGPSDNTHTPARERPATPSIHSTSTQNENIAPSSSVISGIDPPPARQKSTTKRHSTPTGIRPVSHQQRIDITGSSMKSGSPLSPERLHRSTTSPSAASPPGSTGTAPKDPVTSPTDPATSTTVPDVNPLTPTRRHRLPVIVDYVETPRNSAQPTNESIDVDFICTLQYCMIQLNSDSIQIQFRLR